MAIAWKRHKAGRHIQQGFATLQLVLALANGVAWDMLVGRLAVPMRCHLWWTPEGRAATRDANNVPVRVDMTRVWPLRVCNSSRRSRVGTEFVISSRWHSDSPRAQPH